MRKLNKMDEMDRNIRLRSEELGYKAAIFSLAIWSLYECWQSLFSGGSYHPLPNLIFVIILCVQQFSELAIKRKMISCDEEYKEPNKLFWTIIMVIAVVLVVLSIGNYLVLSNH